jgi:hypothetical protein
MRAGGSPLTLVGCLVLAFAGDGRCRELRECRKPGRGPGDPPAGWGDLGPDAGNGAAGHARR